ncbi:MAG: hypothetical protein J6D21_09690 [Clostridia bacterium]|nr:hypothetical protein [Clostridia bacterium]
MAIRIDASTGTMIDSRCPEDILLLGAPLSTCYTRISDDITKGTKPSATPYVDRADPLTYKSGCWIGEETGSEMTSEPFEDGLTFHLRARADGLSEYGINLPFNFMGKRNGGGWRRQFLFNSPYQSPDGSILYSYLIKPNGQNLVVAVKNAAGWKMDYSPYLWAHYFINLKLLASFDRAYGQADRPKELTFALLPVSDFAEALHKLSRWFDRPFLDYSVGGGAVGSTVRLMPYGQPDELILRRGEAETALSYNDTYVLTDEGEVELIPVKSGRRGAGITLYGYASLPELYKKSVLRVDLDVIRRNTDGNLCEHQCWCAATLRFLSRYGAKLTEGERLSLESKTRVLLDVITETNISKAIPHQTIFYLPHEGLPAYNVFHSRRVQELFFGITILLDAYRYYGDEIYYRYAVGATDTLLDHYQGADGRLEIDWGNHREDYTTVCCAMIPLADMARFMEGRDEARAIRYREAADRMAKYLYHRGMKFPTEGGVAKEAEEEMEEGSIACTALALLYYCKNIQRVDAYLAKAKEILDVHESWIIHTPICQMHGSTLRWWETQWEGDADGPAICAGHAWSIWRGEADYLYYALTGNRQYREKAKNGFMTNLSKIQPTGKSYSIYSPDRIPGGGFHKTSDEVVFRLAPHFSDREDCGISRYVWVRLCDTFLNENPL